MRALASLTILALASLALADPLLMVTDTTNDRIMLISANTGAVINNNFIDLKGHPEGGTAMAAVVVGDQIWISDQSQDGVYRYSFDGTAFLGMVGGTYSSPAGIEVVGNVAYIADRGNDRIVMVDALTATPIGTFNVGFDGSGTPYDVLHVTHIGSGPALLIGDASSTGDADNIDLFSLSGTFLQTFHNSNGSSGIDSPQQLGLASYGRILCAGSVAPYGIFEYNTDGTQANYWARTLSARGVYELRSGDVIFTDQNGIHKINRATGEITDVATGFAARHIEYYIPEPAALAIGLLGALLLRRR